MAKPPDDRQFDSRQPLYQRYLADVRALVARRSAAAAGDPPDDIDDLVESNLFYVFQVAWDYRNLGIPLEDLLSEGNLGLIEAAHRFDRGRGVKFITYATWWIRKRILNHVARQIGIVRLPKYKSERLRKLRLEEKRLTGQLHRPPSVEELSRASQIPRDEIEKLRQIGQKELSLEQEVGSEGGLTLEETFADETRPVPEDALIRRNYEEFVNALVERLPAQEQTVVKHRFGFGDRQSMTLADIGRRLGVSRERVRQIEKQALGRLRRLIDRLRPGRRPAED
jgi:RNA polymerase primary sigma factor